MQPQQYQLQKHPYFPQDLPLFTSTTHYVPNDIPPTQLIALFAAACSVLVLGAWIVNDDLRRWNRVAVVWFLICGAIHCFFEGYFVYFHESMPCRMDFFGQLWKEYGLSDSRYIFGDPLLLCMEVMSVFILGPCCFLAAWLITKDSGYRYSVQALVSTGHLYSNLLYFATSLYDDYILGKQYYRPEPFYFWVYFVGMNSIWLVVPGILLYSSMKNSANTSAEVMKTRRRLKDLHDTMADARAKIKANAVQRKDL